ncbi:hypothetical protein MHYP_G00268690 [Metynnis hypsauchen]
MRVGGMTMLNTVHRELPLTAKCPPAATRACLNGDCLVFLSSNDSEGHGKISHFNNRAGRAETRIVMPAKKNTLKKHIKMCGEVAIWTKDLSADTEEIPTHPLTPQKFLSFTWAFSHLTANLILQEQVKSIELDLNSLEPTLKTCTWKRLIHCREASEGPVEALKSS